MKCSGYVVDSVTSDKHNSLISAVKSVLPNVPHQLCTVHIQRHCQTLLTKNPQTEAGIELLEIVSFINKIQTYHEKEVFIRWLDIYANRWLEFINNRTYSHDSSAPKKWWYTHKNLRSAFRLLNKSTKDMFHYLDNPDIPKDTNGLEAEFTHLKQKLNAHRGLTRKRVKGFVNWYWFFKSKT